MSGDLYSCPVEGCDYGPLPKSSVLGHYSGKNDGEHPGGYQKAKDLLSSEPGSVEPSAKPEPSPSAEPSSEPAERPAETGGEAAESGNPVMGAAEPTREPEPVQQPSHPAQSAGGQQSTVRDAGEEPVCIRCGGELYDFRQFETGRYHVVNGKRVWVRGDYQCSSCAMWLEDDEQ